MFQTSVFEQPSLLTPAWLQILPTVSFWEPPLQTSYVNAPKLKSRYIITSSFNLRALRKFGISIFSAISGRPNFHKPSPRLETSEISNPSPPHFAFAGRLL